MDSFTSTSLTKKNNLSVHSNPSIEIDGLSHRFGKGDMRRLVLDSISMQINPGEVVLLTGPSGCGKTTLLTLIGALRKVEEGSLTVLGYQLRHSSRKILFKSSIFAIC